MTKDEILAMESGLEMNKKVAEEVIGHQVVEDDIFGWVERWTDDDGQSVWDALHPYSEDIAVAEVVVEHCPVSMKRIGILDRFGISGSPDELLEAYDLTDKMIANAAKKLIKQKSG